MDKICVDNAIHWINLYPGDNTIDFPNTYPLDSASAIQDLNNRSQTISAFKSRMASFQINVLFGYIWSLKMYHCLFAALQSTLKPITTSKSLFCATFTLYKVLINVALQWCKGRALPAYKVRFGELRMVPTKNISTMAISFSLACDHFSEGHLIHHWGTRRWKEAICPSCHLC